MKLELDNYIYNNKHLSSIEYYVSHCRFIELSLASEIEVNIVVSVTGLFCIKWTKIWTKNSLQNF